MKTTIEFTDRYGGRTPSWLRGCHGDCEAMGCVPISNPDPSGDGDLVRVARDHGPSQEYYESEWRKAEAIKPSKDGWHFVKCPECHGTGRVSWWVSIARIPRWIVKGAKFCFEVGRLRSTDGMGRPTPWYADWWLRFKCAFVYDILRLRN